MTSTRGAFDPELDDDLDALVDSAALRDALQDAELRSDLLDSLVARRHELGLKQKQVATEMETSQSTVSEFENGGADPYFSTLQRYARAVDAEIVVRLRTPRENAAPTDGKLSRPHSAYRHLSVHSAEARTVVYRGYSRLTDSASRATASAGRVLQYRPREQAVS